MLSFIWPGSGHAYLHRRRRAVALALPPLLLTAVAFVLIASDPTGFAVAMLAPEVAIVILALLGLHGLWRAGAIIDSWRAARAARAARVWAGLPVAVLLSLLVAGAHVGAGVFVYSFAQAGEQIFQDDRPTGNADIDFILGGPVDETPDTATAQPGATPGPVSPGPSPAPSGLPGDTNGDGVVDWNDEGWIEDEQDREPPDGADPNATSAPEDEEPEDDEQDAEPAPSFDPAVTPPPTGPGDGPTGSLPDEGPINVLFVGLDSGLGRNHALTDTLILASYFPARDKLTMISIPRDTARLPLYAGGIYPRRINTFLSYARANPHLFPEGPIAALMKQVGFVLGTRVHYYAATDLDGMPRVIDLVGGVQVTLDRRIADPKMQLYLEPGVHHLDGKTVMPYVRSRYGPGNSDWQRARRQQQVIRAAAARVRDPQVALKIPQIVNGMASVVRTNVPRDKVSVLLKVLEKANDASTEQVVLSPNRYARRIPKEQTGGAYMTELNLAAVRELSMRVFGPFSRYR